MCGPYLLIWIDFKNINDSLGHTVGDELLKDTAGKLSECVREIDTIARLGGDKFIVFLNGLEDAQSAQHIAERIREKLNNSRLISGNDLFVTASIGIATFPMMGIIWRNFLRMQIRRCPWPRKQDVMLFVFLMVR